MENIQSWLPTILEFSPRPSGAKLFYADIDKQIETSTAGTLEGFVTMKTKLIHISVKQWADRAVLGVKSIIGWIRTGGKKGKNSERLVRHHLHQLSIDCMYSCLP